MNQSTNWLSYYILCVYVRVCVYFKIKYCGHRKGNFIHLHRDDTVKAEYFKNNESAPVNSLTKRDSVSLWQHVYVADNGAWSCSVCAGSNQGARSADNGEASSQG